MATAQERLDIVEGPGKFDIMVALFDGKKLEFTTTPTNGAQELNVKVLLDGLTTGDSRRTDWRIIGVLTSPHELNGQKFKGYYDGRRRKGHLTLVSQLPTLR